MKKRWISRMVILLVFIVLLAGMVPGEVRAATSGKCGTNVTWKFDTSSGVLRISGTGAITNYSYVYFDNDWSFYSTAPWASPNQYRSKIKSVVIEDGVTGIGNFAFAFCDNVSSVTIPDSVTSIGNYAFLFCEGLTSVTLPDSVKNIGDYAFYRCDGLTKVTIPDSVRSIGIGVFFECYELKNVTIPDSVSKISDYTFVRCFKLTSVEIPNGVTSIGKGSFNGCKTLVSVNIPESVTAIGQSAFMGCVALSDVYYTGTEKMKTAIAVGTDNDPLYAATWYFEHKGDVKPLKSLSIKYWDDLEEQEKTAQVNWGYSLFHEDARNIENADSKSFAELVKISALLSKTTYDPSDGGYLQQALNQLGAENIEIMSNDQLDISYPAHTISHVEFTEDNMQKTIIIVAIRGSKTIGDWFTDIAGSWAYDFGETPKEHPGFSLAKTRIKKEIKTYLSENSIDSSESKILITGHSYGAAVANLLANSLEDIFDKRNIYAYTFATPNTIVVTSNLVLGSNIHNFRNAWDPVVRVPVALLPTEKYTVFGQQHFFTLEEIGDNSEEADFAGNHNCTHYVNYAFNLVEHTSIDSDYIVLKITTQSKSVTVPEGSTAKVTLAAEGTGLTYTWYYKNNGATNFSKTSSFTGPTYAISMDSSRDGRQVYCVVTDKYGISIKSDVVTLSMKAVDPVKIITQPKSVWVAEGKKATVTVEAEGEGLTYKWYYKDPGAAKYTYTSAFKGNTYSVIMNEARDGRYVYCKVTDSYGNTVKSKTVSINMQTPLEIVTQPRSVKVASGRKAAVTVKAEGDGLTYKWYYKDPGSSKYKYTSTFTGNSYSITMSEARSGRYVFCRVYDKYGNMVKTNTVSLKMK